MKTPQTEPNSVLNGICPYFTMFPLSFPYEILCEHKSTVRGVLDPFCGRGTTIYAARMLGMDSAGIDSNPVATAISRAKIACTTPSDIIDAAERILKTEPAVDCPTGEFWKWAYSRNTLKEVCKLRSALLRDARSPARRALLGIVLGALHGPRPKKGQSYLSNQCTRTFAPKPAYSVKYWKRNQLHPVDVDVMEIIRCRANRYYTSECPDSKSEVICGDSRRGSSYRAVKGSYNWIITSPPYYGMRTYIPDQWLRLWFLGAPAKVVYHNKLQVNHRSPNEFADELKKVWVNSADSAHKNCRMVIRYGSINDRKKDPIGIIKRSLDGTPWVIETIKQAGNASGGKRQSEYFVRTNSPAMCEYDIWARKN